MERLFRKPIGISISDYAAFNAAGNIEEEARNLLMGEIHKKCKDCMRCEYVKITQFVNHSDYSVRHIVECKQSGSMVRCPDGLVAFRDEDGDLAKEVVVMEELASMKIADHMAMTLPSVARKIVKLKDMDTGLGAIVRGLDALKPGMSTDDSEYEEALRLNVDNFKRIEAARNEEERVARRMRDVPQTTVEAW